MSSKANTKTVGDFVNLVRGITYKGALVGKPGPALLGLGSIQPGGGFRESDFKTYGGECLPKHMLFPGDLFVSLKGATKDGEMIGSIARVPQSISSGRITQDTVKLELKQNDKEFSNYLYWLLRTPQYRKYCANRATGSAVVALSREDFLAYPVPPLTKYRSQIVSYSESADEKMRNNRSMIETLESVAQAIFKEWFIDFGPVKTKAEGNKPSGMDDKTAALFPNSFEESELGMIPKGWHISSLDLIANFLNGLAMQKYPPTGESDLPVIKIAQLRANSTNGADLASTEVPLDYVVIDGDVLFSWSGTLEVSIWTGGRGALNQHIFKVTSPSFPKWFFYQWCLYHLNWFKDIAASKATTMGHIQRSHLKEAKVVIPPTEILEAASKYFDPLIQKIISTSLEDKSLRMVRDLLLPRLLSGEIDLRDSSEL